MYWSGSTALLLSYESRRHPNVPSQGTGSKYTSVPALLHAWNGNWCMRLEWGAWETFFRQGSALLSNATLCLVICLAASLSLALSPCGSPSTRALWQPESHRKLRRSSQFQQKLLSWHLKLICKLGLDQFRAVGALLWHWHRPPIMLSCWLHRAREKKKKQPSNTCPQCSGRLRH